MASSITFAGVGSAFATQDYWQSNMYIETDDGKMMVDCGGDARFSFGELGVKANNPDAIYISHLHADHIGGLEWLGFSRYFSVPTCPKMKMYISGDLVSDLWRSLQSGMQSYEGIVLSLESFFDVVPILPNGCFRYGECVFTPVQTVHVMNGFRIIPSYGLLIRSGRQRTFLTTDTQFCPRQIERFYKEADVIFQDCETSPFRSGVHAHYDDLKTLAPEIKAKMWLYHYQPNPKQNPQEDGFCGFIHKGQKFDL